MQTRSVPRPLLTIYPLLLPICLCCGALREEHWVCAPGTSSDLTLEASKSHASTSIAASLALTNIMVPLILRPVAFNQLDLGQTQPSSQVELKGWGSPTGALASSTGDGGAGPKERVWIWVAKMSLGVVLLPSACPLSSLQCCSKSAMHPFPPATAFNFSALQS